ncbi:MAG: hypothetical protein Unbinned202contig1002_51 [Prokaryotic dsDNA virus sp.]|nr:MAG: hypothetical protein Unbinned202contig1002_51 [Prokaryotic dsDNA virus sp.]
MPTQLDDIMKARDIPKFRKWALLGGKLVTRIVKDAGKGISQDPDGKPFPAYKESYANLKKIGKAGAKGTGKSRQINPPDLRLTGEMLNSIKAQKPTNDSVEINYRSGLKVLGHSKKRGNKAKRNIIGLNDKNWEFAKDFIADEIDDRIIKFYKKKVKIDLEI